MKRIWRHLFGFALLVLPVVPTIVQAGAPAVCLIGDHPGIPESDAQTAALLVCAELRKQGISVSDPVYEASASTSAYRVVLRRLGEKILVHLSQETPIGTIFIERQLWIANIKEMSTAAPKLVNALLHEKPIASNVAEHEARELQKIKGGSLWHIGFLGVISAPSRDLVGGPGFNLGWSYETPSFAVGGEFQISGRAEYVPGQDSFLFYSESIGGRYFFNKQNISPYIGGGLARISIDYKKHVRVYRKFCVRRSSSIFWTLLLSPDSAPCEKTDWKWFDDYEQELGSGLGMYGVVGIEFLRFSQNRLKLELRLDRPFFNLPRLDRPFFNQDIMPITFGISFSRNYVPGGCCLF